MIESRSRKAAFLRDVVRALGLCDVQVLWDRLQNLGAAVPARSVDVVTVRALRIDKEVSAAVDHALNDSGLVVAFGPIDYRSLTQAFERQLSPCDQDVTILRRHAT
jgi:16S rRNA G527 N7-methylase RsmG